MYQPDTIYHLYNHSNNYEVVFRSDENYLYFLRKVRREIAPLADILSYCLMPDHFHFLVVPNAAGCSPSTVLKCGGGKAKDGKKEFQQMLSHRIKILLSSYTKAVNHRYNRRGSLFRPNTKSKTVSSDFAPDEILVDDYKPAAIFSTYPLNCFHYIHNNPAKADLAITAEDWPFSSAADYAGLRNGSLCNYNLAKQLIGVERQSPPASSGESRTQGGSHDESPGCLRLVDRRTSRRTNFRLAPPRRKHSSDDFSTT